MTHKYERHQAKKQLQESYDGYEQQVRSVAESLSVFGGPDGGAFSDIYSFALSEQIPTDRLYAWMYYMKHEVLRSHFMNHVGNHDPVPGVSWEPTMGA